MNLMERNKQLVHLRPAPDGRDADAAPSDAATSLRAVVTPLLSGQKAYPFGIIAHERVQLLYDGPANLQPGMRVTLRPGETNAAEYAIRSVRRYPSAPHPR